MVILAYAVLFRRKSSFPRFRMFLSDHRPVFKSFVIGEKPVHNYFIRWMDESINQSIDVKKPSSVYPSQIITTS